MKKSIITFITILSIACCGMSVTAQASTVTEASKDNLEQAEQSIYDFFYVFENVDLKYNITDSMRIIAQLASNENRTVYSLEKNRPSLARDDRSFLNTVEYMLQRREYILNSLDTDENEYNKKIDVKIAQVKKKNDCLEVQASVYKTWNYIFSKDVESAAKDEYNVTLIMENGKYVIQKITGFGASIYDENLIASNDEISQKKKELLLYDLRICYETDAKENISTPYVNDKESKAQVAASTYDGGQASSYALNHALNYNPNYADFSGNGGDCTNFISQCLYAGGISQHVGTAYSTNSWFYKTSTNRSATWTSANIFKNYVTGSSSKINMPSSSWGSVTYGDIIQLLSGSNAYHSMIVSGIVYGTSGRSDLLICCHSADRRHVSLSEYFGSSTKKYYHVKGNK